MATSNKKDPQKWILNKSYKIQKYAIDEYLRLDIIHSVVSYMFTNYQLPKMTAEEEIKVWHKLESTISFKSKEIFENERLANRFLKFLANNFRNNGGDSFAYTCRSVSEDSLLVYMEKPKKNYEIERNKGIEKLLNPLLDEKANNAALMVPEILNEIRNFQNTAELELLERLAKKHNKKIM